ncbi:MAG: ATP-binding protein, partial [Desulfuromonadales bacterium]|nr:ATP-binding protein [Desulfuromonadales bacterium]
LGTNGEIALTNGKAVWATSAAAGPAFEGGNLSSGMAALPGAILKVSVDNERLNLKTVDDKSPVGICGSGVISLISTLLHEGVLDATGFLRHPEDVSSFLANHLREINNERHFVLYQDAYNSISLSQSDIRGVQLAKAGIRGGIEVLLQRSGVSWEDLSEVVITGSFGASLPPEDLAAIGMLPDAVLENTRFTENGVIKGAVSFITSAKGSEEVDSLACSLKVVPLSGTPVFERYFIQHMNF